MSEKKENTTQLKKRLEQSEKENEILKTALKFYILKVDNGNMARGAFNTIENLERN